MKKVINFNEAIELLRVEGTLPLKEEIREKSKKQAKIYRKFNASQLEKFNSLIDELKKAETSIKESKETIKVNITTTEYKDKPIGKAIGSIQKEIQNNTEYLTVRELAEALTNRHSFKLEYLNGGTKASDWTEQQVFCYNGLTIQEAIHRAYNFNLKPSFIYPTFSHTEDINRRT